MYYNAKQKRVSKTLVSQKGEQLPRGAVKQATCLRNNITVLTWKDTKEVSMAGTTGKVKGGKCHRRARSESGVWERK